VLNVELKNMFVKTDVPQRNQNIFCSRIMSMLSIHYEIMKKKMNLLKHSSMSSDVICRVPEREGNGMLCLGAIISVLK
jgi:hypothetical protein